MAEAKSLFALSHLYDLPITAERERSTGLAYIVKSRRLTCSQVMSAAARTLPKSRQRLMPVICIGFYTSIPQIKLKLILNIPTALLMRRGSTEKRQHARLHRRLPSRHPVLRKKLMALANLVYCDYSWFSAEGFEVDNQDYATQFQPLWLRYLLKEDHCEMFVDCFEPNCISKRHAVIDCMAVAIVALLSLSPYRGSLGFYSDDHWVLALLATADDPSISNFISLLIDTPANIRPVQVISIALLYHQFGLSPFGYQMIIWVVYTMLAPALYLVLWGLRQPRLVALAAALLFVCLPQCSTNRLWFAALQIPLSAAFYFVGLYCDIRTAQSERRALVWATVGTAPVLCSTLAYELTLPLFLLNPFIAGQTEHTRGGSLFSRATLRVGALVARNVLLVSAVAAFKLVNNRREQMSHGFLKIVVNNVQEAFVLHRDEGDFGFNLWQFIEKDLVQYGVGLPYTAVKAFARYPHIQDVVSATAVAAAVAVLVLSAARIATPLCRARWLAQIATGFVLALAGYAIFLIRENVQFTLAGIGNRVSMMTLPGIAIALIGITGLIGTTLPDRRRPAFFAVILATLCASGTLINAVIASFFVDSTRRQEEILSRISTLLPSGINGGTLLIGGLCPYLGPAVVFEGPWDITGALRIRFNDPKLHADFVNSTSKLETDGIHTTFFYGYEMVYPYGTTVRVVDLHDGMIAELRDRAAAAKFFGPRQTSCPPGQPGVGVRIF
jgi:hypothetical protein